MFMPSDDPLWYKDAIIYQLHVKAFQDGTGDGMGDFRGLAAKLDYVADLGVTAIWLLPFYPSPLRDDGYDISDYRRVHPAYGSVRDFKKFVREAHDRGLRVITELVVNHTSDQHPWFQRARHAKRGSAYRDWYVWSDTDQRYQDTRIIFTDTETSNWAWDPVAQAYYWHRFFSHQPDLNFDNPRVVKAVTDVMRFWLQCGVDGFRLDAVPYLCEREGTNNENLPETHDVLKRIRTEFDRMTDRGMLLAEANQWPEDVRPYFGSGDECHMAFHFPVMPRLYMAIAQEDRYPIVDIMRQTPDIPETCQWAVFLRNHDELTLEMVSDRERDYLWNFYAQDRRARINLGIRRRLAPLLENDRRKIELMNALLMSLPGTPIVYYGDEIGMGDNIFLGDRDAVRTPMQWSPDRNGGFSTADPARLYLPPIMDPVYGYEAVNVEAQQRSGASLLNWMKRLIAVRKAHQAFGRGTLTFLAPGNRKILAYLREYGDETILCVANLSRAPQPVELDLSAYRERAPIELLGRTVFPSIGELPYFLTLPAYGFYWFVLTLEAQAPSWHEPYVSPLPELRTLVLPQGWRSLLTGQPLELLEQRVVPEFLEHQRWFAGKGTAITGVTLDGTAEIPSDGELALIGMVSVTLSDGAVQRYCLPLALAWESRDFDPTYELRAYALSRVRKNARLGVVYDALADPDFARGLVDHMREQATFLANRGGEVRCTSTRRLNELTLPPLVELPVHGLGKEQSNTSVIIGDSMILKLYRKIEGGAHPELEIGRFLTDVAAYPNTPPLLGAVEYDDPTGQPWALAILQGLVANQGDGWTHAVDYLNRFLEERMLVSPEESKLDADWHAPFRELAYTLGRRTAELHRAFAHGTTDPAFRGEPVVARDLTRWGQDAKRQARAAFSALRRVRRALPEGAREKAEELLDRRRRALKRIDALVPASLDCLKTRYHGDLHLGQVILVERDFYILDFEGEPARALAERRRKHSPLRDVAGMLRSFNYATWTAMFHQTAERPEAFNVLWPWATEWEGVTTRAFLAGYTETIGDCPSYPRREAVVRDLLDLFTLEKAFYEVCYEVANRPQWATIPLTGALALLED